MRNFLARSVALARSRPDTLLWRLTRVYAMAFALFLSVSFLLLYLTIKTTNDHQMDEDLREDIDELSLIYARGGDAAVIDEIRRETVGADHETAFLRLLSASGDNLYSSDLEHWPDIALDKRAIAAVARGDPLDVIETWSVRNQEADTRVIYGKLTDNRVLQIGESMEERQALMAPLPVLFSGVFLFAVLMALTLVWWLTRQAVQGITEVSDAAERIRGGELSRRVHAVGQVREVQALADTFDAMANRIERLITEMRDMTDNIAHDLRSPLTRIRVIAESALQTPADEEVLAEASRSTIDECDRLVKMINISLDVSEAEAGVSRTPRRCVALSERVIEACELFDALAEVHGVLLTRLVEPDCYCHGVTESLERMLANIIDNAIKFTPPGGTVRVELATTGDDHYLSVADTGVGMDASQCQRIFDRFYRGDNSRSVAGCGLGLSYSQAVARFHGGNIDVQSQPGVGSLFAIRLPVSSPDRPDPPVEANCKSVDSPPHGTYA